MRWERIADVNLNRLAESLKLIEDSARFLLQDRVILKRVRKLRHDLTKIRSTPVIRALILYRDSAGDPGRPANFDRPSLGDHGEMINANVNRAKESCRILEELFKLENLRLSRFFKAARFHLYDVEKTLNARFMKIFDPSIYAVCDEKYVKTGRLKETAGILLRYGVTMIQLRIKTWSDRRFLNCARILRKSLVDTTVRLIINDRPDIALSSNADGVHLGQDDLPVRIARRLLGGNRIVGASVHSENQAIDAQNQGADYLGVGALYPSCTKEDFSPCSFKILRRICRMVRIPVIGIGGIDGSNYQSVINCGAAGIAVGEYLFAGDIRRNLRRLTLNR